MFRFISPIYFFLSLGIGLFVVYIMSPQPKIVYKFPSPYNSEKVTYNNGDSCFKVKAEQVECPSDDSLIKSQPLIQE
jgi:hypothetical protein